MRPLHERRYHVSHHESIGAIALMALLLLGGCKSGPTTPAPKSSWRRPGRRPGISGLDNVPADYRSWWRVFNDPPLTGWSARATRRTCPSRWPASGSLRPGPSWASPRVGCTRRPSSSPGSVWRYHESAGTPIVGTGVVPEIWRAALLAVSSSASPPAGRSISGGNSAGPSNPPTPACRPILPTMTAPWSTLTASVANIIYSIRTLEKRLDIARQKSPPRRKACGSARTRFEGGTTSQRDVEQARSRWPTPRPPSRCS